MQLHYIVYFTVCVLAVKLRDVMPMIKHAPKKKTRARDNICLVHSQFICRARRNVNQQNTTHASGVQGGWGARAV